LTTVPFIKEPGKMKTNMLNSERGVATLVALLMMGMLLLIGLAALTTFDDEVTIAGNEMQEMRAFYAAEAGLEQASAILQTIYDSTGSPPDVMPTGQSEINDCVVAYAVEDDGPEQMKQLSTGALSGLNARVKSFSIKAIGISPTDHSKVTVSQSFESALVPIFQYSVFYNDDLEISAGADLTQMGRVHTNSDIYIQSTADMQVEDYITAAGKIRHGNKAGIGGGGGDVKIRNIAGDLITMKDGADWMDADNADWYDSSVGRWQGRVQDAAHGQERMRLPLAESDDPHKMIDRGAGNPDSYEHEATLIIKDGVVTRQLADGSWQDVTAAMITDGTLSYAGNAFYDQRELNYVDVTDLDIGKMYANGYAPTNGVVYFADNIDGGEWPALRVKNGSQLSDGLTIASENPLYTVGDFNSTAKKPAALMADAITVLSDNWVDAKGVNPKGDRIAMNTTINAALVTGSTESTPGNYNGGLENLAHFLETWTGNDFTWTGSAVNLWKSNQATGAWNTSYYSDPTRKWTYDTDLNDPAKHPPASPTVQVFQRTGWSQEFVNYAVKAAESNPSL